MNKYLVITPEEVSEHLTAVSALEACGVNQWETALPALALRKLNPGDSYNVNWGQQIVIITGLAVNHVR